MLMWRSGCSSGTRLVSQPSGCRPMRIIVIAVGRLKAPFADDVQHYQKLLAAEVERVDVAGPGFLNLFVSDAWFRDALTRALAAGERFGAGTAVTERILVEFVSANPTGPITVASARHAAYGDSLGRIL